MRKTKKGTSNLLVILLIIVSFFAGYLFFKLRALEGQKGASGSQEAPISPEAKQKAAPIPKLTNKDHIRGDLKAELVLVEYSDLECPFCKSFHSTMNKIIKDYQGKVAWVYRHYPLDFHANAQKEAEASECVAELGGNEAFWKYVDAIFERTTSNGTGFALDKLAPLAKEIGLNEKKFKECLDSGRYTQMVKDQMEAGGRAGVQGTPNTFVVAKNGKKDFIGGALPYEQVKAQIDALLK